MTYGIVGFGTAGYHAVKAIRNFDKDGQIDVYCNTGLAPYNPMLTTYYASDRLSYEGMFPFGPLEPMQKELKFNYITDVVTKVHAKEHMIDTENGSKRYDKILIASGAHAFGPPVKGAEKEDVFFMRTIYDAESLKQRMEQKNVKSAVVVGASMVGIKIVELLNRAGVRTCLADLAEYIFPLAAYRDVGEEIQNRIEKMGIDLKFKATVDHVEIRDGEKVACMTDGSVVPADIIVLCIGTRANTEIVKDEVAINRGIIVNDKMETSEADIYAAGDCCEGNNLQSHQTQIIGLWANANHQGTVAGCSMTGHEAAFEGNILHNITHFMDMDFIGFGDNRIKGDTLEYGNLSDGLFIRLVCENGHIAGANILDNYRISGIIKNYMLRLFSEEKQKLPDFQRGMLKKAGLSEAFMDEVEERIYG